MTEDHVTTLLQDAGLWQGDVTLREQILEVIGEVGVSAHPDDIVVTPGSQMALDLVTRVFCDPGDVVLVEAPSYVGALGVFRAYQVDVEHVGDDTDGGCRGSQWACRWGRNSRRCNGGDSARRCGR